MLTGRGHSNRFRPSDNFLKDENLERSDNGPENFKSKTASFERFPKPSSKWFNSLKDENGKVPGHMTERLLECYTCI
ncbi:hypothetical protein V6N13_021780 [Hibiscus sabdariffa]|uniref:Uncharacterized protein n=1 Tax=Hibiscus sabdariffa TaxID=183260 RepID=A0ABR2CPM6_9ROSI